MTGIEEVPRGVRLATLTLWLTAPVGLLLVLAGLLEMYWWGTGDAARLAEVFRQVHEEFGLLTPALIRDRRGAAELIVLGVVCLAGAALALFVRRGSAIARTSALVLNVVTLLYGLFGIGADLSAPLRLGEYLDQLRTLASGARIPEIQALVHPAWYAWLEDVAQGLQVLAALAVLVTLGYAMIWHPHFFRNRKADAAAGDQWGDALRRIRQERAQSKADA